MARIAIDARMLYATGIGRYVVELLDGLQTIDKVNEYVVILRTEDQHKWAARAKNFSVRTIDAPIYSFREQTALSKLLTSLNLDLVHFLNYNSPLTYNGSRITTVHDLTLLDYSVARGSMLRRSVYAVKRWVLKWFMRYVLRRSAVVITDTEFVRHELIQRGITKPEQTKSIALGVPLGKQQQPTALPDIAEPFVLYVGNFFPYKNIGSLIEAMPAVLKSHPSYKLVLVGKQDEFQIDLAQCAESLGIADQVIFTGYVSDPELVWLYQHAALYVFPSFSEGFGLPGLEAMRYDVPVAAAKASCLPEVYEDAAAYFDPANQANMAAVITDLLSSDAKRKELVQAGRKRLRHFSWSRMAEQTLEVYRANLKGAQKK